MNFLVIWIGEANKQFRNSQIANQTFLKCVCLQWNKFASDFLNKITLMRFKIYLCTSTIDKKLESF